MGKMSKVLAYIDRVSRPLEWLAWICVFAIMVSTLANVIMRRFLNMPIAGIVEIDEQLLMGMVFFALCVTQAARMHVAVTFVVERFSKRTNLIIDVFVAALSLAIFIILIIAGIDVAIPATRIHESVTGGITLPIWPMRWFIPVGSFFCCFTILGQGVQALASLTGTKNAPEKAAEPVRQV